MATLRVYVRLLLLAAALTGAGPFLHEGGIKVGGGAGTYEFFVSGCDEDLSERRNVAHGHLSLRHAVGPQKRFSLIADVGVVHDWRVGRSELDLAARRTLYRTALRSGILWRPLPGPPLLMPGGGSDFFPLVKYSTKQKSGLSFSPTRLRTA